MAVGIIISKRKEVVNICKKKKNEDSMREENLWGKSGSGTPRELRDDEKLMMNESDISIKTKTESMSIESGSLPLTLTDPLLFYFSWK